MHKRHIQFTFFYTRMGAFVIQELRDMRAALRKGVIVVEYLLNIMEHFVHIHFADMGKAVLLMFVKGMQKVFYQHASHQFIVEGERHHAERQLLATGRVSYFMYNYPVEFYMVGSGHSGRR